jgi:hypothetical protein
MESRASGMLKLSPWNFVQDAYSQGDVNLVAYVSMLWTVSHSPGSLM